MKSPRHLLLLPFVAAAFLVPAVQGAPAAQPLAGPPALAAVIAADIPPICATELPPEADDTIRLIDRGGPYPYPQDGTVFQNREGLLPDEPAGFYREYTVETPGVDHRGARRIVTSGDEGHDGMYYTDDHYESFSDIDFAC
ncbi:ribonuclease domain-containing protein [Spirillospora sp. NPDC029432]|uniref:ribonuclease domain-containing protein n=1 Tax=Spirillospora sp. NPDC029432 TaxID=3154599 RepID=UPI0034553EDC